MPLKFGRVLQNLYIETRAAVWNGKNVSEWFQTNSGVRQGCALSPSLFALFIDDIVEALPGGVSYAEAYLGVYLTQNLKMERHLTEKLSNAKTAINVAWRECFSNNYIAHSSKYKVFESVSQSILFYAAQVWGAKKYETVEKLLRFYVKRIFRLPTNTPNYMIMLETGLSPLFMKTLKLQIDYILKVLKMSNDRLPKKVALQAIRSKTGWIKDWIDLAQEANVSLNINEQSTWKATMYKIIARLDENFRQVCMEEASNSQHRMIYSRLNHNLNERNYFRDGFSIEQISNMFRVRGELLNINFIPHREDLPLLCEMCNMNEREDVFHFVGRCPVLRETRRHILGSDFLTENEILDLLNEIDVVQMFKFCKTALNYRKRILNEYF